MKSLSLKPMFKLRACILFLFILFALPYVTQAATKTSAVVAGKWSNPATWSPAGVPASGDYVIIHSGDSITVDGAYTCNSLDIGDATVANTILVITTAGNSLTVNGDLRINPSNVAKIFTISAGAGTMNIAGTLSTWSNTGTNNIQVSTGALTFTPAISLTGTNQNITCIGAGAVTFNSLFTDNVNRLITFAGCTVNFGGSYTVNTTFANWAGKGTANFTGSGSTITANSNLTLNNFQVAAAGSVTLASAVGTVIIAGTTTLGSGSTFTANENFEVDGNWTNNGGTFSGGTNTLTLNGIIAVTGATTFPNLQMGNLTTTITSTVTLNSSVSCSNITYTGYNRARSIIISTGDTLMVSGNVLINQPASSNTNSLAVSTGTCIITGNVTFTGTATTAAYVSSIAVTTGTLNIAGTVSYDANTTAANQVISVSTGTVNFTQPLTMASGTLTVTGAGAVNFNGTTSPSFNFGGSNNPVFNVAATGNVYFVNGFTNNTNALTLSATSNSYFTGNGSITPNAAITFGNTQINTSVTDTLAAGATAIIGGNFTLASGSAFTANENFEVDGNWVNSGGVLSAGSNTVILNGAGKTIGGTTSTAFPNLQIGSTAVTVTITMNNSNTCSNLLFNSAANARTLTLTTGDTLTVNGDITINQPSAAVINTLAVNAGTCIVSGNINLPGTVTTAGYIAKATVTTGSLIVSGAANWGNNTTAANEVITVSTGSITLGTTTMASGTLSLTGAGTINFNGATAPSFTFGGTNAPVFTTFASCNLNFNKGFTNNTNALVINATANSNFTGNGSITPNASITFGHVQIGASAIDTMATAAGTATIAGNFTLGSGSSLLVNGNFEVDGNWINNGGALTGAGNTVILSGAANTIGGTSATAFPILQIGNGAATVSYTMNNNNSCTALNFNSTTKARTLTLTTGDTLTVNGDVTINQPTAAVINALAVNAGTCIVTGNINLPGTTTTASYIAKAVVTTGSLIVSGAANYGNNTTAANAIVTVSTGIITLGTTSMASGTLSITGAGTINFNGTITPSFTFGGANAPVFTAAAASNLNFKKGFTNNTNALVLTATSNSNFTGSGAITPNGNITFGNMQITAADTVKAATGLAIAAGNFTMASASVLTPYQAFEVDGNWINNGGSITNYTSPVIMNGAAKTIGGSSSTVFDTLQIGSTNSAVTVTCTMNNSNSCSALVFNGFSKARTLTISTGTTLSVNGNVTINQATAAVTNTLAVGAGTCNVTGNLVFAGTVNTTSWATKVSVTSGAFTLNGNVTWMSNTAVTTEVITVSTGTITFASPLVMGTGTGTLSVTGTGTVNFNSTTAPSFTFGGAATAPSFTTVAGCNLYFNKGITTNTQALVINATSNTYFKGSGSITANAALTFGHVQINASVIDTLVSGGGAVIVAGNFTLLSGSVFNANKNFEVDGNWVNNSATLNGGANTVTLGGNSKTIGGTVSTTFPNLQMGNAAVAVSYTMNISTTCNNLTFNASTQGRSLTLATGDTLAVAGNLTINQPTGAVSNILAVNAGVCTVSGNMLFTGTSNTVTRVAELAVTSGSFTLAGTLTWMANTVVATEVIALGSGTINFNSAIAMASSSGTLQITGAGTVNFNSTAATCFTFGGATAPAFATVSGSTINFAKGITATTTPLTFASGSNEIFTGTGTITPTALITFSNLQIASGKTITLAGNIAITGNWADNGTFTPATYTVNFNGSGTQTIGHSGGETFYGLTVSTSGAIVKQLNNVTVTNALTMNGPNINTYGNTLTLGSGSGASLTRSAGMIYGGTLQRWFPATAITNNSGSYYGLFPIGDTAGDYIPVSLNTTVNPTTPGYVSVSHTHLMSVTILSPFYVDNEGSSIQEIGNMHTDLSTSSLAGGAYNLDVTFASFSSAGNISDLKLETNTGNVMGSAGTHGTSTGTTSSPNLHRTGLTMAQLNNAWVAGTNDRFATPLYAYYYSRKSGNWNDATVGNATWSFIAGGSGASCDCSPNSGSYVVIDSSHTVTVTTTSAAQYLDVFNAGSLTVNSTDSLNISGNLTFYGTGTLTNNGVITTAGDLYLPTAGTVTASSNIVVNGTLTIPSGTGYTQTGGTLISNGNVVDSGTITVINTGILSLKGNGTIISGNGTIIDSAGSIQITNAKSIPSGALFTIGSSTKKTSFALAANTTMNSSGSITLYGDVTGAAASSVWANNANATLSVTGNILTTGTLDAAVGPNTINYNGSAGQIIQAPANSYYNLTATNAGTKILAGPVQVDNAVAISGTATINDSIYAMTGAASLNMSGTSGLKLQRSVLNVYPELTGTYNLTGGTVTLNQTGDSAILQTGEYYKLKLNGSTPYDISGISNIDNNLDVQSSAKITNNSALTIAGNFNYSSSAYSTLADDIIAGNITLSGGTLDDGGNIITLTGTNWNKTGGSFVTTGQTVFAGSAAQNIIGTTATTFFDLAINNKFSVTLNVSPAAATAVTDNLNLMLGNLNTDTLNILRMLDTATVTGGSAGSYVSGPMVKVGVTNFTFPIGKSGVFGQAGISGMTSPTTEVTAEFFKGAYTSLTPVTGRLHNVSNKQYWIISRAVTTDSLQMQLYWNNAYGSNVYECANATIAHFKSNHWVEEPATAVGGSDCSGAGTGSLLTVGYVTSFSPFTFGGYDDGALPIQLVSFNAVSQGKIVEAQWSTDLEINNAYFTVERSADAINFSEIARLDGAGNSTTTLNYSAPDENPLTGVSYYRLRQTDFNGNSAYSNIVSVNRQVTSAISLYPNPAVNECFITVTNPAAEITLNIVDITGREVYKQVVQAYAGSTVQTIPFQTAGTLNPGIYIVSVSSGQNNFQEKLIVK